MHFHTVSIALCTSVRKDGSCKLQQTGRLEAGSSGCSHDADADADADT